MRNSRNEANETECNGAKRNAVERSGVEWSVMSRSGANGAPKIEAYEKIKEFSTQDLTFYLG